MFNLVTLFAVAAAAPLALAAPASAPASAKALAKRSSSLKCVEFQYGGPFTSFGANGFIHLYSNITTYHPETETTTYNETRLGLSSSDGTVEPCGDCRTTELWGFEVCQGPGIYGFGGLVNSPAEFYGHVTYRDVTNDIQCVGAQSTPYNGSALVLQPCQYDFDDVASSGQYFSMSVSDSEGTYMAKLVDGKNVYGPNSDLNNGSSLTLYDGNDGTYSYLGFKAPVF